MPRLLTCDETGFAVDVSDTGTFKLIDIDPRCPDDERVVLTTRDRLVAVDGYEMARRHVRRDQARAQP